MRKHAIVITALASALLGWASCSKEKAGMPYTLEEMDLSDTGYELWDDAISLKNNEISYNYSISDFGQDKNINYKIKIEKDNNNKIVVNLEGKTYFSEFEPESIDHTFTYNSFDEFSTNFTPQCNQYLEDAMMKLLNADQELYKAFEETDQTIKIKDKYETQFASHAEMLNGWLKHSIEKQHLPNKVDAVQKDDDKVIVPLKWGSRTYKVILQKAPEEFSAAKYLDGETMYSINIDGKTTHVKLDDNVHQFANELFDQLPNKIKNEVSDQDKYEKVLPKLLEAFALLK